MLEAIQSVGRRTVLIFGPGQGQVHRECVEGELFDLPVSVECSNSNRHFVFCAELAEKISLSIKGGGRTTRLLPHPQMQLIQIKIFSSAG